MMCIRGNRSAAPLMTILRYLILYLLPYIIIALGFILLVIWLTPTLHCADRLYLNSVDGLSSPLIEGSYQEAIRAGQLRRFEMRSIIPYNSSMNYVGIIQVVFKSDHTYSIVLSLFNKVGGLLLPYNAAINNCFIYHGAEFTYSSLFNN